MIFGLFSSAMTVPSYRALTADDAADVAKLHAGAFAYPWERTEIARMILDRSVIAEGAFLKKGHLLVSFVMSRLAGDEAEIISIATSLTHRGKGLAFGLLSRHMAQIMARGATRLFLEVEAGNSAALALYARLGFLQVGTRPAYYVKPDGKRADAIIMRRDLR